MSLNGLDDVKVKEAHEAAVAEAGGWYVNPLISFSFFVPGSSPGQTGRWALYLTITDRSLINEGAYTGSCSNTPVAMRSTS